MAVVVVHASKWPAQHTADEVTVFGAADLLARFCVPAFVVLSGVVLGYRYPAGTGEGFLARRVRRSLVPWLVWAPLYFAFGVLVTRDVPATPSSSLDWWTGGGGHLYYLVLVPQLYLLFLLWPRSRRAGWALAGAALALQAVLSVVRLEVPIDGAAARGVMLWHAFELFPFWVGYFAVGVELGRWRAGGGRWPERAAWPFLAAVPLTAALLLRIDHREAPGVDFLSGTGSFLRPLMPLFVAAICGATLLGAPALLRRSRRLDRAAAVVGRHSLGIYIVHPMLLAGIARGLFLVLQQPVAVSLPAMALTVALTLLAALALTRLLVATPAARTLGVERQPLRHARRDVELVGRRASDARSRSPVS